MKKLITGVLATLACCACFTGCDLLGGTKDSSTSENNNTVVTDVAGAADYLEAMYNEHEAVSRVDYERITSLMYPAIDGYKYTITWSVNVSEDYVELVNLEGKDKILVDVDEQCEEEVAYVLTATVSDGAGKEEKVNFNYTLQKGPSIVPQAITSAPVVDTAYKLYMYQVTKKGESYFTGKMSGFYLGTDADYTKGVDVKVEAVADKDDSYYLTFNEPEGNKKMYIGVTNTYNNGSWHDNAIFAESTTVESGVTATFEWKFNDQYDTMTAYLKGVKEGKDQNVTTTANKTFYLGTYSTYWTFGASDFADIAEEDSCIGKLVTMLDKTAFDAAARIADEKVKTVEAIQNFFTGETSYTLPKRGQLFSNVKISWAVKEGDTASVSGNVVSFSNPEADTEATLTATLTCGDVTETVDVLVKHYRKMTASETITAAYALETGMSLSSAQTLTGVVTEITSAYQEKYGNVSFVIVVEGFEDKPITAYRVVGEAMDTVKVGDTATVTGVITNHKGTIEFVQDSTLDAVDTEGAVSDKAKLCIDAAAVELEDEVKAAGEATLPLVGSVHNSTISWASNKDCAVVEGGKVTYTLPAEATTVTLTATVALGEVSMTFTFEVEVAALPKAGEVVYDFSTYTKGVQYADETHTLDSTLSMHIVKCHLNTQLRIYDSSTNDGIATFTSTKVINKVILNAGKNAATLNVYGSANGTDWTLIQAITTVSAFADYTVEITNSTYKYLKLDADGAQIQVAKMTIAYAA